MVEVLKPNGQLQLCLDPRDLNKVVLRENYTLPTIKDVATRLQNTKVFSKLDARNGFWQINLDDNLCFLTTFPIQFGQYRWRHLPFGVSSTPEVSNVAERGH